MGETTEVESHWTVSEENGAKMALHGCSGKYAFSMISRDAGMSVGVSHENLWGLIGATVAAIGRDGLRGPVWRKDEYGGDGLVLSFLPDPGEFLLKSRAGTRSGSARFSIEEALLVAWSLLSKGGEVLSEEIEVTDRGIFVGSPGVYASLDDEDREVMAGVLTTVYAASMTCIELGKPVPVREIEVIG